MQTKVRKNNEKTVDRNYLTSNSLHFVHKVRFSAQYYKDHVHLE